jgi:Uma2 family endonuclease
MRRSPPPSRVLEPFVIANNLGIVFRPRAVLRFQGSEVEPDLMVRQPPASRTAEWEDVPTPSLVVEILSPTTRRREHEQKRGFYLEAGVGEYWIVDPERTTVTVIRPGAEDRVERSTVVWHPVHATSALSIDIAQIFD